MHSTTRSIRARAVAVPSVLVALTVALTGALVVALVAPAALAAPGPPGHPAAVAPGRPSEQPAAPHRLTAAGDFSYLYASAFAYGPATRMSARLASARPAVDAADHHSLVELAMVSADGQQIVEVGWTVDRAVNGDARPHLFVYHWVDGQPSCYNACGFVSTSAALRPGGLLHPADGPQPYALAHVVDRWWVSVGGRRLGYFPDSLWQGRFTRADEQVWFGEVAAGSGRPCTDMGNGRAPTPTSGQLLSDLATDLGPVTPALSATDRTLYDVVLAPGGIRLGGAGAC